MKPMTGSLVLGAVVASAFWALRFIEMQKQIGASAIIVAIIGSIGAALIILFESIEK